LWERFPTAMDSAGLPAKIVVKNHSHQQVTLPINDIRFLEVS
jgi:hypothetical protein